MPYERIRVFSTQPVIECMRAFEEQDMYVLASLGQLQPNNLNVGSFLASTGKTHPDGNDKTERTEMDDGSA